MRWGDESALEELPRRSDRDRTDGDAVHMSLAKAMTLLGVLAAWGAAIIWITMSIAGRAVQ